MTRGTSLSLSDAVQLAVTHHQAGRIAEARAIYDQVLAADPTQFDALHLAGVAALQLGDPHAAIGLISRAVDQNASVAAAHHHLGEAYRAIGALPDAERCFLAAIAQAPYRRLPTRRPTTASRSSTGWNSARARQSRASGGQFPPGPTGAPRILTSG
jgi:tetratricopeptide (TPR) repeat protein